MPPVFLTLQLLSGSAAAQSMIQDHWTMRHGLPQNSVTDLQQDEQGYVWATTYGGVVRFDGRKFTPLVAPGLTAQRFLTLWIDGDRMWLGSEKGGLFLLEDGHAQPVGPLEETWVIAPSLDGERIWVGGRHELFTVTRQGEPVVTPVLKAEIRDIHPWGQGLLGVSVGGEAVCLEGDCGDFPQGPPVGGVQAWVGDGVELPLVATIAEGVFRYEEGEWRQLGEVSAPSRYLPIPCDYWEGELWCALQSEPFPVDEEAFGGMQRVSADSLLVDQEMGLWVGTDGEGLYRHQKTGVELPGPKEPVLGVGPAGPGRVWAWIGLSAVLVDLESGEALTRVEIPYLGSLWADGDRTLVGSYLGIGELTPDGQVEWLSRDLGEDFPAPVSEGPWMAVGDTLYRVEEAELVAVTSLADEGFTELVPVRGDAQEVWVQGDMDRLLLLDRDGKVLERVDLPVSVRARDVQPRAAGGVWVGTYGSGMLAVEGGRVVGSVGLSQGGCDDMVSHFFSVPDDPSIWVNTNRGLGRLEEESLEVALAGEGLASCSLQGSPEGNGPRGLVTPDGRIVAPTIEGVVLLDPRQAEEQSPPRVLLESLYYAGEPVEEGARVHGAGGLTVQLAGIYFRDPHSLRFRYRLLGLDQEWSEVNEGLLRIASLPPGNYRLEIQARAGGDWGPVVERSFVREPSLSERPMVRTWLPLGLAVGVMSVLASALVLARRRAEALQEEVARRERVQSELDLQTRENARIMTAREAGRRMESLGRLSSGMAHDFNNLFTVVRLHAAILEGHPDPEVQEEAQGLIEVVESGADVARGLLTFGRSSAGDHVAPICESVKSRLPLLRRLIRADLELVDEICVEGDVDPSVRLSRGQVDQILTNLVINARDATPGPGRIWIRVRLRGDRVLLEVQDEGVGMEPQELARALEPYFTTKALERGTGLGLSTVHGLTRDAGGSVRLESTPGEGTLIQVELPVTAGTESEAEDANAEVVELKGLRVLVVDDSADLLRTVRVFLESEGAHVLSAEQPERALELLGDQPVDLALLDVVMPGMTGPRLRDLLLERRPGLRVVFMSGYTGEEAGLRPQDPLLQKPFSPQQLKAALVRVSA